MASLLTGIEKPESLNFGVFIQLSLHTSSPEYEIMATPLSSDADRMIGVIGVFRASITGIAEVGYVDNESFWGQGYASEALATYVNTYCDHIKTIDAIVAMVDLENTASITVLRKCGFIEVEYLVEDIVLPALGRRDTIVFQVKGHKLNTYKIDPPLF
jgi:RimJ/RimL family protein N-acetyltransferase